MLKYIRISVTYIVTTASLVFMACSSPVPPRNISQVEQTAETKDPGDSCLWNQFVNPNLTCENCTFCPQGTEHSPNEQCGYGRGAKTTCTPCAERSFQMGEGYTGLVCRRCVTCYRGVEYLQNCTTTQDAECGPCPPGEYYLSPNICFECMHDPSHPDCLHLATTVKPTASSNQSAPTLPSLVTKLPNSTAPDYTTPSPLSSQAHNTSNDFDEEGTPSTKFTVLDSIIVAVLTLIVICVTYLAVQAYKKYKAGRQNVLPSKSPNEESGPLISTPVPAPAPASATPAPASATPAPASATPAPASATPTPASVTPAPSATPAPASATPAPASATPAPASATPVRASATSAPASATPAPVTAALTNDLFQGASNPGNQPTASVPSDVSNTESSLPRALCSDGGPVGDHDVWCQNQQNHDPGSPDSAKVNFVFENDDGSVLSLYGELKSNEEA